MPDERKQIIDRANRMLQQSRTLRRLADELQQESRDLKTSAKAVRSTTNNRTSRKQKMR
jgi:hypothetical protein